MPFLVLNNGNEKVIYEGCYGICRDQQFSASNCFIFSLMCDIVVIQIFWDFLINEYYLVILPIQLQL